MDLSTVTPASHGLAESICTLNHELPDVDTKQTGVSMVLTHIKMYILVVQLVFELVS